MKICVYFDPKHSTTFEGARLRKNIKGALEREKIQYTKNIIDSYDIVHFISLNDEAKINDTKENNIPVVFSALYCESDKEAETLTEIDNKFVLSKRAIKLLNKVDVILVSDDLSKSFLLNNNINARTEVLSPGVNINRFIGLDELGKNIFNNYFQVPLDQKIVTSICSNIDKNLKKKLIEIAEGCPDFKFYIITDKKNSLLGSNLPANLKIVPLINTEIYCSLMYKASIFLALDNTYHNPITLLDAAASKTQIVAVKPYELNESMFDELCAYKVNDVNEAIKIINQLSNNELEYKVDEAFETAKKHSLENVGKKLKEIYLSLMEETKND